MIETATDLTGLLSAVERSSFGEVVRLTPRLYPLLMSIHVFGIALMVGSALAVDLRLLGIGKRVLPVTALLPFLLRISHVGFVIILATGIAMFAGIAVQVGQSAAAPWKFGLIGIALANILIFHRGVYRSIASWDFAVSPPWQAKIAAMISAACWIGVIVAGRFLAY